MSKVSETIGADVNHAVDQVISENSPNHIPEGGNPDLEPDNIITIPPSEFIYGSTACP